MLPSALQTTPFLATALSWLVSACHHYSMTSCAAYLAISLLHLLLIGHDHYSVKHAQLIGCEYNPLFCLPPEAFATTAAIVVSAASLSDPFYN